jgi:hypothetical protein
MVKQGFFEVGEQVPDPDRAGRPIRPLAVTPKLVDYATRVPEWREKVDFFRIKQLLGYSEADTLKYLLNLGSHNLSL